MKLIKTVDAVGHILCHDLTQVIKGVSKDARFRKGHIVREEDIPVLLNMGKENLYVWEADENLLHEDEAAETLRDLMMGENMTAKGPKEGKYDIFSDIDGLLMVDVERLRKLNSLGEMMAATRYSLEPVKTGDKIAGTRIIPLVIEKEKIENAKITVGEEPILKILPFNKDLKVGIVTTGSEVYHGRIKDTFTPVIIDKLAHYGIKNIEQIMVPDEKEEITAAILEHRSKNLDFIICTGGMSVDPDDKTPGAISDSGAKTVSYGSPVLPGAMFMLSYFDDGAPIVGLPACVMYSDSTIFDIILPRIIANVKITNDDISALGHGGLCLACDICTWPICSFGKGR